MLGQPRLRRWSEVDQRVFECLVPETHYLRRALAFIDFERFREVVAEYYSPNMGRPSEDPVLMIKLEFLQYHDRLSDRQVIERAQTDVAYRYFLNLGLEDELPDSSVLCYFRGRLTVKGHQAVFQDLVAQAREHGLVKDRLRLTDATHVIADVALPAALTLVAQMRDKLLTAVKPFDPLRREGEVARSEAIHQSTRDCTDAARLTARVAHLREILAWVAELPPPSDPQDAAWQYLLQVRKLAHKVLSDQDHPEAGDRTRSVHDPEARRGKHGEFYDGYLADILLDSDSELITSVGVLPANGDEAANIAELVRQEEAAQGNDVQQLSIDGIAFQGEVLRELQDPQDLQLEVFVPPKAEPPATTFGPDRFAEDAERGVVTCPAGQTSQYRQAEDRKHGTIYRFHRETCTACPLLTQCMEKKPGTFGRSVRKNHYEREYRAARAKATTPEYAAIRREHPKIERKLSELVNRHGLRRARYRGLPKMLCQTIWTAVAANVKRMVRLLCAPTAVQSST